MAINTYIANPVSQTITDGVTNKAPSENAIFDALALKQGKIFVNVQDYGATGDGITDDTTAFANALTYIDSLGGGTLYIPNGIYNAGINNTYSNITFLCDSNVITLQVWHIAVGKGPDLSVSDPNYQLSPVVTCENIKLIGGITCGSGGRIGTFYCNNVYIDSVTCIDNNYGVHIYSHSENVNIGYLIIESTISDLSQTGGVFIDQYLTVSASIPKNITIEKIVINQSYLHGVFINCDGFHSDEIIISNTGLSGCRITKSNNVSIGRIKISSCGTYSTPTNFLRTGLTIDDTTTNVNIGSVISYSNYSNQVYIKDSTTKFINIGSVVSYSSSGFDNFLIESCENVNIQSVNTSLSTKNGIIINNAKKIKVSEINTFSNTESGIIITGTSDNVSIEAVNTYSNTQRGIIIAGAGTYYFENINCKSNGFDGLHITGLTGVITISSITCNGLNSGNYRNGILCESSSGFVNINSYYAYNYTATGAKALYSANFTGIFHFSNFTSKDNGYGIDISSSNTGYKFSMLVFSNTTVKRAAFPADTIFNQIQHSNAAPVAGDYLVGDKVINSTPTSGGNIGWVCTTAGTPGVWKAYGTIA